MAESNPSSWREDMSGRERIRYVVELLEEPTPVQEIADRANVSRTTADDELQRLQSDDWVTETTVNGTKAYDLNPVRMLFDEVTNLIEKHSRDELESQLTDLKQEQGRVGRRVCRPITQRVSGAIRCRRTLGRRAS